MIHIEFWVSFHSARLNWYPEGLSVVDAMEAVFVRSDEVHLHSMDEIMQTLTVAKAMDVIQQHKS